jgi:hypothetical protein
MSKEAVGIKATWMAVDRAKDENIESFIIWIP